MVNIDNIILIKNIIIARGGRIVAKFSEITIRAIPYNKRKYIIIADGAAVVFLSSRFPTFQLNFPKIFFHANLVPTIANTAKK